MLLSKMSYFFFNSIYNKNITEERIMNTYIYETIEHRKENPAKIILASIDHSDFHWHYDYEIVLVLKGEIILSKLTEYCLLQEGDMAIVNSKEVHGYRNNHEENICLILQVKNEFFNIGNDRNQTYYFYLNSANELVKPKVSYDCFRRILAQIGLESCNLKKTCDLRLQGYIYHLAANLFDYIPYDIQQYTNEALSKSDAEDLLQISKFVERNYSSDTIAEDLCKTIGMSEKSLYRFLKSRLNMTMKELIELTRMDHALYLLSNTNKDNSIIAQECGFCSDNTFYRAFKKTYGMTPLEYKSKSNRMIKSEGINKVQGYLDFNRSEALRLLKKYVEDQKGEYDIVCANYEL
jgi:AraC-like DNA-binding protein/quercetin dioxygenase-like cupin family protein